MLGERIRSMVESTTFNYLENTIAVRVSIGFAVADIGVETDYETMKRISATALSEAAVFGDVNIIQRLLRAGADPDSANRRGQTALMLVARTSNVAAARALLKAGAKVNAIETTKGQTALMWAAAESQPDMVRELLQHGARANLVVTLDCLLGLAEERTRIRVIDFVKNFGEWIRIFGNPVRLSRRVKGTDDQTGDLVPWITDSRDVAPSICRVRRMYAD